MARVIRVGERMGCGPSRFRPDPEVEMRAIGRRVKGKRVLELGCGDGRLTVGLAAVAREVVAVDPDPSMIAAARARKLPRVTFRVGTAEKSGAGPGSFDTAVYSWTL